MTQIQSQLKSADLGKITKYLDISSDHAVLITESRFGVVGCVFLNPQEICRGWNSSQCKLSDFGAFLEAESPLEVVRGAAFPHQPCSKGPGATSEPTKIVNSLRVSVLGGMSAVKLRSGM